MSPAAAHRSGGPHGRGAGPRPGAPPALDTVHAAVPAEHRWVSVLFVGLARLGAPVREARLTDGALTVRLEPAGADPLVARLSPRAPGLRGWAETEHLVLGHDAPATLAPAHEALLRQLRRVARKLEPTIPRRWRGFATVVAGGVGDPAQGGSVPGAGDRASSLHGAALVARLYPFLTIERSERADPAHPGGPPRVHHEVLLRTISQCNEACPFCSGPKHHRPDTPLVLAALDTIAAQLPGALVSLTGGEPTLKAGLMDEVRHALALPGVGRVQVQTNATRLRGALAPERWPRDPRLTFFISLHAVEAACYDAITGSEGLLPAALEGLAGLTARGHRVTVNTVVTDRNVDHLEAIAEVVAGLPTPASDGAPGLGPASAPAPGTGAASEGPDGLPATPRWHLSVLMCPEQSPGAAAMLVPYTQLVPRMAQAVAHAQKLGLHVDSLLSSTHASVPACLVPASDREAATRYAPGAGAETGYQDVPAHRGRPWVKAARCRGCVEDARCLGVPAPYAGRFGLDELSPL